jgi:hypothetical protein
MTSHAPRCVTGLVVYSRLISRLMSFLLVQILVYLYQGAVTFGRSPRRALVSRLAVPLGHDLFLKPLKPKFMKIILLVRTSKRTQHFITKINCLTLLKEIIAVYCDNRTKPINTKYSSIYCLIRWYI